MDLDSRSCYNSLHGSLGWRFLNKETFGPLGNYVLITQLTYFKYKSRTFVIRTYGKLFSMFLIV